MDFVTNVDNLKPNGHYSQAVIHNGLVYVSGQFSVNPETGEKLFGTMEEEARRVLQNIDKILQKAGSSKEKVLKVTIYINDLSKWGQVNKIYGEFFGDHYPARSIVTVPELHFGFKLEMEAIAAL